MIVLDRIMELLQVTTDKELAAALDVGSSTISMWRRRGSVPLPELRKWTIKHGKPLSWFMGADDEIGKYPPIIQAFLEELMEMTKEQQAEAYNRLFVKPSSSKKIDKP